MKTLAFFFVLISTSFASEESVTVPNLKVAGITYIDATVSIGSPNEAKIQHKDGNKFLDAKLLPEDLKKRLGYDAKEAEKAQAIQTAQAAWEADKRAMAKVPVQRFWVWANTEEGLIVGNFEQVTFGGGVVASGMSRVGGGGGAVSLPSKTTWERGYIYAFFPHTEKTRNLTDDEEFEARVIEDGTKRIDEETLVKKYRVIEIKNP